MTSMKDRIHKTKDLLGGYLCLIPSAVATQALAAAGADWLVIDQEHGPIGMENLHAMIAATAGTNCSPWVRVAKRDEACVKPALDAGAEGIMFPLVRTAAEAAECVALTRYPPHGRRGWGPFIAHSRWSVELQDYLPKRGPEAVCGILIETKDAVDNIEDICKVEGIDYLMVATFDLSTDLAVPGKFDARSSLRPSSTWNRRSLRPVLRSAPPHLRANRRKAISAAVTESLSMVSTC